MSTDVTTPTSLLTSDLAHGKALDVLLASGGNIDLACELLSDDPLKPLPKSDLVRALSNNPAELQKCLRTFALLETHMLRADLALIVRGSMLELSPKDAVTAYKDMAQEVEKLTQAPHATASAGVNVQVILDNLPREAGNAVQRFAQLSPAELEDMRRHFAKTQGGVDMTDAEFTE